MKERASPSFRDFEIRAILNRQKTQMRIPMPGEFSFCRMSGDNEPCWVWWPKGVRKTATHPPMPIDRWSERCPYGVPGDRLWIKEPWACVRGEASNLLAAIDTVYFENDRTSKIIEHQIASKYAQDDGKFIKWRRSIHMPRWASRITLEIVNVRVEKVQEITDIEIASEGLDVQFHEGQCATAHVHLPKKTSYSTARGCFALLWDSINAKRGFRWEASPWTWVIEFKVC